VGPFFEFGLVRPLPETHWWAQPEVVPPDTPGAVSITGVVFDGQGMPVPDAMIETWQADPAGRFPDPDDPASESFRGFARCGTDAEGRFRIVTVKPGRVPWIDGRPQAPHLDVSVFARGLLHRLVTRLYFPDEAEANAADPVLLSVVDPAARETLIARQEDGGLRFDIRLQGDGETCFFQI
jgi:protocatechuate 3,4-dioxygenase alpha subunit